MDRIRENTEKIPHPDHPNILLIFSLIFRWQLGVLKSY